eukprot:m.354333 g.354333  ORF g.354333 m.354333 type:complete len:71 (-) comp16984_c0_seq1:42-254(-)
MRGCTRACGWYASACTMARASAMMNGLGLRSYSTAQLNTDRFSLVFKTAADLGWRASANGERMQLCTPQL